MAHNRHFLAWSAMLQGRKREAVSSARAIENEIPAPLLEKLGFISDGVIASKWHVFVRFGLWEDIISEPAPPEWAVVSKALQHYARGIAFANSSRITQAREELSLFDKAVKNIPDEDWMLGGQPASEVMPLARLVLIGEIEFKAGNQDTGLSSLKKAVELEEELIYAEPSAWMMPARHAYGALLIVNEQYKEAEQVYLKDLEIFPANGWALLGLRDALRGQKRFEEAEITDKAFKHAWKSADVIPPASCYCGSSVVVSR